MPIPREVLVKLPMLLIQGTMKERGWENQSRRVVKKLREQGGPHEYLELSWATHDFDCNPNNPGVQIAEWAMLRFLEKVKP